jgi:hypothetical protein
MLVWDARVRDVRVSSQICSQNSREIGRRENCKEIGSKIIIKISSQIGRQNW